MSYGGRWNPTIVAARAFSANQFAVAYGELEYDNPFTAILDYDEGFTQPWARIDVAREIQAITPVCIGLVSQARFIALSNEGDVYFIADKTFQEKIIGAGVGSPDATGAGAVLSLVCAGATLYAVGQEEQVFKRTGDAHWDLMSMTTKQNARFRRVTFTNVVAASADDIYLLGYAAPKTAQLDPATEKKLLEAGDWDAWNKANAELAANSGLAGLVDVGHLTHFDGANWHDVDLSGSDVIKDAFIETPDKVWLVGTGGTLLVGNARTGFRRVDLAGFSATFLSITKLNDIYVLASDYALHTFDGHRLTPLKPRLRKAPPNPFRVQAIGDMMFYFDYKQGVHRYDGTTWTRILIPLDLLKRTFTGLPRQTTTS